ncbi:MAG: MerR family transcriptional regulator [Anaerolineae bacterium]
MNIDSRDELFNERPIYNIGAVERMMEIPAATLRAWERRYGFPKPERTPGGHRIYSEKDVEALRWIKARLDEGLQISQAIEALRALKEAGRPLTSLSQPTAAPDVVKGAASPEAFAEGLLEALLDNDTATADALLGKVLSLYPLEDLLLHVIRPTLREIGERWLRREINVAVEHAATHYLRHRLIMWLETGPPPYPVSPTLLACAPDELHEGGLLILGVMLRRRRWPVSYLGQSLPLADLAAFVRATRPSAVVIAAMRTETAETLSAWPRYLPQVAESGRPPFTYGGLVFTEQPAWRERVPGIFLGPDLGEGLETLVHLLRKHTK